MSKCAIYAENRKCTYLLCGQNCSSSALDRMTVDIALEIKRQDVMHKNSQIKKVALSSFMGPFKFVTG